MFVFPVALYLYSSEQYTDHLFRMSLFFSKTCTVLVLYSGGWPLLFAGQVFHQLVNVLAVILLQCPGTALQSRSALPISYLS